MIYLNMNNLFNLNPVLLALFATLFTYLVTALGASLVFFFKKMNQKVLDVMLGLASGIMIAAAFWSLILPAISLCEEMGKTPYIIPAFGFLLGGLFIICSDVLLQKCVKIDEKKKRSILLSSAVTLHNIPEGMAIGVAFGALAFSDKEGGLLACCMLALGIGIQNFPEGVCVSMPLRKNGETRLKSFLVGQASGIVEPIAGVLGALFALAVQNILPYMLTFSAGAMIAVVCSELIPDAFKDNKVLASLGVIFGFIIMMVLDIAFG